MEETKELKAGIEALLVAAGRAVSIAALARCLGVSEDALNEALHTFEADLQTAGRGIQLQRGPRGIRIQTKPLYAALIGQLQPERKTRPISSQALETLAIVALRQPVSTADINAIRGIESVGAIQTLRSRRLIARSARTGTRRERFWRTTRLFLETFSLASLDDLYKEGRMEEVFAFVCSGEEQPGQAEISSGKAMREPQSD